MSLGASENHEDSAKAFIIHLDKSFCLLFRLKIFLKLFKLIL
jgi:hypothetical protein